ncbi:MAG: ATP-dependent DNA helicase RecG [Nocardioidaceae bacterium]
MRATVSWDSKLATVAGKSAPKIEKALGLRTVGDLLRHYPRRYVDKGSLSGVDQLTLDEHVTVIGKVVSAKQVPYQDRRRGGWAYRLEVAVETEGDSLTLTFFDKKKHLADWRAARIVPGRIGQFSGKVGKFRNKWQLTNPQTQMYGDADDDSALEDAVAAWDSLPDLITLYPATATVQSWQLAKAIALALDLVGEVPDPLPAEVKLARGLVGARQALEWVHRPDTWAEKGSAEKRLRFEEAFVTQTVLAQRRAALRALDAQPRTGREGGLLDRFDGRLPFTLTAGQQQVSEDILADLAAGHPMHRLLQGEVGSGKTVVALRAMLRVVDSGGQAVLLAPTEVLAQQHHRSITAMLGDLAAGGMLGGAADGTQVALLTGSLGAAARREAMLDAASGAAGIVIGTHALLEDKVQFADLGLVVVDEQHRFGVEQRAALTAKAGETRPPHVLVMTATPIPRTVAMTVFGDLETSTLTELPAGRAPIQTSVVALADHPAWLDRAFQRVREEVGKGHQVYVVCPRIDDTGKRGREDDGEVDTDDAGGTDGGAGEDDGKRNLAAVERVAPMLAEGPLHGLRVEMLHGRMPSDRKDEVMRGFAAGDIDVLVATTVIEVGVDVANATMMLIFDADRYGVSQLHQLRGRVGRGGFPGLCLLVTPVEQATPARERLDAVAGTLDGFELSRVDLEQRREGDVLGAAQSGRRSSLRLLSVLKHEDLIVEARESASAIVDQDPTLAGHPALADEVRRLRESAQADYLEKA